jgi:hypothetical protein
MMPRKSLLTYVSQLSRPENRTPEIIRLTFDWVAENSTNGFIVGTVQAKDPDGDELTYTLIDDAEGRFIMDGKNLRVLDGSRFDDEIQPTHKVTVLVEDGRGGQTKQDFIIRVMDRDEDPVPHNRAPIDIKIDNNAVFENVPNGTLVGHATNSSWPLGRSWTTRSTGRTPSRFRSRTPMVRA